MFRFPVEIHGRVCSTRGEGVVGAGCDMACVRGNGGRQNAGGEKRGVSVEQCVDGIRFVS